MSLASHFLIRSEGSSGLGGLSGDSAAPGGLEGLPGGSATHDVFFRGCCVSAVSDKAGEKQEPQSVFLSENLITFEVNWVRVNWGTPGF